MLQLATACALLAGCGYAVFHLRTWGYDDAYISYRYAGNLAAGHGLVFNPGEYVEGYSNFLYVLILAIFSGVLPKGAVYAFSVALNTACMLAVLPLLTKHVEREVGAPIRAAIAALLFAMSPLVWEAVWSGLETCLVLLLFVAIWRQLSICVARDERRAHLSLALLCCLAVLARADGFVLVAIVVGYLGICNRIRLAAMVAGVAGTTFLAHVAARLAYYGWPLPNTYYVKVSGALGDRISHALGLFGEFHGLLLFMLAIAVVTLVRMRRGTLHSALRFDAFFAVIWTSYWFYIGGDIYHERFLLPLIPLGCAAIVELAPRTSLPIIVVAPVLAALVALPFPGSRLQQERTTYDEWDELGRFLGARHEGELLAVDGAGKIPFYSGLHTIDMLGLSDEHIAHLDLPFRDPGHSKRDTAYVLRRRPDLIAARVANFRLDMSDGLSAPVYRREGYALRYLVYLGSDPPDETIRDVSALSSAARVGLLRRGFWYGVLARSTEPAFH